MNSVDFGEEEVVGLIVMDEVGLESVVMGLTASAIEGEVGADRMADCMVGDVMEDVVED